MGRVRAALLRATLLLTEAARANHEPVNVAPEGVELVCPTCKTEWPCPTATMHTEHLTRLRKELAE